MSHNYSKWTLAALSLTALGFMALPVGAYAQDTGTNADTLKNDQLDRPINLDVKSANLYYALTMLFDQLKVDNYTIPEQLKQMEVSAHFTKLPLRTALETLLKNRNYTYNVVGGVYNIVPKIDQPDPGPIEPRNNDAGLAQPKTKKIYRLSSSQMISNSVDIVTRLGGRILPGVVGSQAGAAGSSAGGGLGNSFGGGIGGGTGGFGGGQGGFSSGGGGVGGGGYYGGGNNFGSGVGGSRRGGAGGAGGGSGGGGGF